MANTLPPRCYGDLNTVFPLCSNGLRETPATCMPCVHKTQCLRAAMGKASSYSVREEMVDRAYRGGVIGFYRRWSQKKSIHRLKKKTSNK